MRRNRLALAVAMAFPWCPLTFADTASATHTDAPTKELGVVTITGGQPTSLPTQIPTTMEGITSAQIEQAINATDSEDALGYFPSLLVRKLHRRRLPPRICPAAHPAPAKARARLGKQKASRCKFFTVDLRVRYRNTRTTAASLGIEKANNSPVWNFHPHPQRSYVAELKIDL